MARDKIINRILFLYCFINVVKAVREAAKVGEESTPETILQGASGEVHKRESV